VEIRTLNNIILEITRGVESESLTNDGRVRGENDGGDGHFVAGVPTGREVCEGRDSNSRGGGKGGKWGHSGGEGISKSKEGAKELHNYVPR